MQTEVPSGPPEALWEQISPMLDEALAQLGEKDRQAILLRFFEDKSLIEVSGSLGTGEDAARMRINRALEKLHRYFSKRGISSTTAILAGAFSANSVQAAPVALTKTVAAAAMAKGAAAGGSTLTLIQGALKLMAWTKAKVAIMVSACVLIAAGTTTIAIYNMPKPIEGIPKDWSVLRGYRMQWDWANGAINGHSFNGDCILASLKKYRDVTLSSVVCTTNRDACLAIRMQDADNGYFVLFVPDGTPWAADNGSEVALVKRAFGEEIELASFKRRGLAVPGQSAKITVRAIGPQIEVSMNDVTILKAKDATFDSGFIGLRVYGDTIKPCDATFSKLTIR